MMNHEADMRMIGRGLTVYRSVPHNHKRTDMNIDIEHNKWLFIYGLCRSLDRSIAESTRIANALTGEDRPEPEESGEPKLAEAFASLIGAKYQKDGDDLTLKLKHKSTLQPNCKPEDCSECHWRHFCAKNAKGNYTMN